MTLCHLQKQPYSEELKFLLVGLTFGLHFVTLKTVPTNSCVHEFQKFHLEIHFVTLRSRPSLTLWNSSFAVLNYDYTLSPSKVSLLISIFMNSKYSIWKYTLSPSKVVFQCRPEILHCRSSFRLTLCHPQKYP